MEIIKKFQDILNSKASIINTFGNRPKNLTNELLPIIKSNYTVSIKADGIRCFLYYDNDYLYSIKNPFIVNKLKKNNSKDIYCIFVDAATDSLGTT